jgi:hypothetical protein
MARKLLKKQKDLLINIMDTNTVIMVKQLSASQLSELEAINDYETLYQDADRFIQDLHFAQNRQTRW